MENCESYGNDWWYWIGFDYEEDKDYGSWSDVFVFEYKDICKNEN